LSTLLSTPPTESPAGQPRIRHLAELPGPRAYPVVGNALQLQRSRIHLDFEQWAQQYGPTFQVRLGPTRVLVLTDHEAINGVMKDRPEGFRRPSSLERVVRELGGAQGLFSAEGQAWHNQRRMVMAAFSPTHVRAYFPALLKVVQRLAGRWHKSVGQPIDLQGDLMRYTVDAIAGLAFGVDTNTLESDEDIIQRHLDKIFPAVFQRLNALVPYWRYVKLPSDRDLERSLTTVREAIAGFIDQARLRMQQEPARREQPTNLIEAMIVAADHPDSGLSDAEVAGNVFTMLLAGEDTTANTLAWLIHLLHRNPATLRCAQDEVRRVVGDLSAFSMDQLADLPYLDACIQETMRLKPVAPFRVQEALRDTTVADVRIPAGTLIWCVSRHDAMDDAHFANAHTFDPTRWMAEASTASGSSAKKVSTPFGAGPRVCPGRYLAMVEMKVAMAMLLSQFDIERVDTPDGKEARELMSFTMTPVGLSMRLRDAVKAG
jgi:cytochrome P450